MDVREKLIELLLKVQYQGNAVHGFHDKYIQNSELADYLITHGVTVQECGHWISLTECANSGVYCSVCHKKVYKEDYAGCNRKNKLRSDYCPHCGAKMMSHPTKGE